MRLLEDALVTEGVNGFTAKLQKNGTYTVELSNYEEGAVEVTLTGSGYFFALSQWRGSRVGGGPHHWAIWQKSNIFTFLIRRAGFFLFKSLLRLVVRYLHRKGG